MTPGEHTHRRTIGIDARTFFYSDSMARGVGQYSLYHLLHVIRQLPDVQFVFYGETLEAPETLHPLLALPNVNLRLIDNYQASQVDLFHICDPLNDLSGFDFPLRIFKHEKTTATFYDINPVRCYLDDPEWKQAFRDTYLRRLGLLINSGCQLLAISEFTKQDLINYSGMPEQRITTIMAGLNGSVAGAVSAPATCDVLKKFGILKPYFLHVGAHDKHKNFMVALAAFIECRKHNDIQLVVVGKLEGALAFSSEIIPQKGINDVIFTGFVSREDLESLYQGATATLFLSSYEGFGFPVLEAFAGGCPVITTNVTSIPEVAGNAALLCDPLDVGQVVESMIRLLDDRSLASELRTRGFAQAQKFTWDRAAELTIAAWEKLLGDSLSKKQGVVWLAPFLNPSGYTSEAFAFVQALLPHVSLQFCNISSIESREFVDGLTPELRQLMDTHLHETVTADNKIVVFDFPAYTFQRPPGATYVIGRTMFETDSLPAAWVDACSLVDEVWVPSAFNKETFQAAGVPLEKIRIVHAPVDTAFFDPSTCSAREIKGKAGFNFLTMFEWSARKGWDVLLKAYFSEFDKNDDVCLYIKTYLLHTPDGDVQATIQQKILEFASGQGFDLANLPRYEIISRQIPFRDLPAFYRAFDCFVLPSRGEGWGRPYSEAMSMGLPVIGTNWSGNTEFMTDDNSYLIPIDGLTEIDDPEIPFYKGHRWAEPSVAGLKGIMRKIFSDPEQAQSRGEMARKDMLEKYSCAAIGKQLSSIIQHIQSPHSQPMTDSSRIIWQGSQFVYHSLALVNREICRRLIQNGHELSILTYEPDEFTPQPGSTFAAIQACVNKPLSQPADVVIRHQWPPDFTPPPTGHLVMIQPWEFGSIPSAWVEPINSSVDEVWAYTTYVRDCYVRSGVYPDKVHVVPLGVDIETYKPGAKQLQLPTRKSFRFLFVGGTIQRKGIDLLLAAYRQSFTAQDDVCLVIKDMGGASFYQGQTAQEMIQRFSSDPGAPEIVYIDSNLSQTEMASLYRSCHCLVHPYRGEGFGLPIAEAMSSGLPVIVTGYGAALDFCPPEIAWLVPAQELRLAACRVGDLETVDLPWLAEPDLGLLSKSMRHAFNSPEECRERGKAAAGHIRDHFSWDHSVRCVELRLQVLRDKPVVRFSDRTPTHTVADTTAGLDTDDTLRRDLVVSVIDQARMLHTRGNPEAAITMLVQRGIGAAPQLPEPYLALAELLMREQRFSDILEVVAEMPPATNRAQLREIEAICHAALGNDESAYQSANQANGSPRALVVFGTLAARQGDLTDAEKNFRQAIVADSCCGSAWMSLGMLLWGQRRQDEAWQAMRQAVAVDPLNNEAVKILLDMAERLDQPGALENV
jgi:glycosyltransferase involved in cell wall biosynthesis